MPSLFASTASGLEELLKRELIALCATDCKITAGGVHFCGDEKVMYQSLLWSRLASRILLPLREFVVHSDVDIYTGIDTIDWAEIFPLTATFSVNFVGTNEQINNSQYGALCVKDAIVDQFLRKFKQRPNVAKQMADIRIYVYLSKNSATVSLDLSGEGLHQRGYRQLSGQAPIKENLAAAIVLRSGWQKGLPLLDPMCGSGTLLIEAAMIAANCAPGLKRQYWGFLAWKKFNAPLWQAIMMEATETAKQGIEHTEAIFWGKDQDRKVIDIARQNAKIAGVDSLIHFNVEPIANLMNPSSDKPGIILSNPPYGERLNSEPELVALYTQFGMRVKQYFNQWQLSLFSGSDALLSCLQLRASKQFKAKNGSLDCVQKNYVIGNSRMLVTQSVDENGITVAGDFANRLLKNDKKFTQWAKQEHIDCYRIYDADLPEYNVAIDRYVDYVVVQEYSPPKTVDPHKSHRRLLDIIQVVLQQLVLKTDRLILKTRSKQKGKQQYQKLAKNGQFLLVHEYNAELWVNLTDYLDTGLFLDHRLTRKMLATMSDGKDFLNLFAYTGTATVHAGLGGAKSTTTVDMSNTYLKWAERNLQQNHLTGSQHRVIQMDCFAFLQTCNQQFDLIFIDPPTFSNSKRMEETLDIQRDHVKLLSLAKALLHPTGAIVFSSNRRNFKMDLLGLADVGLLAKEITSKTVPLDFKRNPRIHHCWLIKYNR